MTSPTNTPSRSPRDCRGVRFRPGDTVVWLDRKAKPVRFQVGTVERVPRDGGVVVRASNVDAPTAIRRVMRVDLMCVVAADGEVLQDAI